MRLPKRFTDPRFYKTKLPTVAYSDENALEKRADEYNANLLKVISELMQHFDLNTAPADSFSSFNYLALILMNEFRIDLKSIPKADNVLLFGLYLIEKTIPAAVLIDDVHVFRDKVFKAHFFKAFMELPMNQAARVAKSYGIKRLKQTISESKDESRVELERALGEMFAQQLHESVLTEKERKELFRSMLKSFSAT